MQTAQEAVFFFAQKSTKPMQGSGFCVTEMPRKYGKVCALLPQINYRICLIMPVVYIIMYYV